MSLTQPRILVIRGGAIGDFILTLPAIRLLRENFPGAHLEIMGYQHIVALAERRFYADAIRSIEYGPMAGFFVPNSVLAPDLVEYFSSFQQVVSYLYDPESRFETNLRRAGVKNFLAAWRKLDDSDHAVRQLAAPLQQLALWLEDPAARVFPLESDLAVADAVLRPSAGKHRVAIHPGSGGVRKNWPAEKWAAVAERLRAASGEIELLLVGGEADEQAIANFRAALSGEPVRIVRDLPLPHLAAVLARCDLFLGHDSGISHLAAAVGTPCLLLFGPTDPDVWSPQGAHITIHWESERPLADLDVETVAGKARALLAL